MQIHFYRFKISDGIVIILAMWLKVKKKRKLILQFWARILQSIAIFIKKC